MTTTTPACCPPGSWPQLVTTSNADLNKDDAPSPKGTLKNIPVTGASDLPLYVVEPSSGKPKGSILIVPDIYSVRYLMPEVRSADRIGSISDALAEEGYLVAIAGIFRDKPFDVAVAAPEDGEFTKFDSFAADGGVDWFKDNGFDKVGPDIAAAVAYLKEANPEGKVHGIGFCFGTWAIGKACSTGVAFDSAVWCHPTSILEKAVFGGDEAALLGSIKVPTLVCWAGNDDAAYTKDGANQKAIEATGGRVEEFADQLHGWVSRGDVSDPTVKAGVEKALNDTKAFLASH